MDSWGDPKDEWRGLAPMSTHTLCFNTSYGIPDLCTGEENQAIPDAQRRDVCEDEHAKWVEGMHTIHTHHEHFTDDNLADCLDMLASYTNPPKPFDWIGDEMKLLYSAGAGGPDVSHEVAAQQALGLPVGEVGQFYVCMPFPGDDDTFILGIIRDLKKKKINKVMTNGVNMQWLTRADPNGDKYSGIYKSVLSSSTRYMRII